MQENEEKKKRGRPKGRKTRRDNQFPRLSDPKKGLPAADILAALADRGASAVQVANMIESTAGRIQEMRAGLERIRDGLAWVRDNEADLLDLVRADMLHQFLEGGRRWSAVDYAVALDKARLLRGQVQSLSGLVSVIRDADAEIVRRLAPGAAAVDVTPPELPE